MENNEKELEERELKELELMNENEDRRFYVYEHIRLDNNTCFYVGKGTGDRAYNLDRGNFHNGVCKEHGCRVEIIKDNLTEEEAFKLETERIEDYVITFGYGINIEGYDDYDHNLPYLTNFTWGGEGTSGMNPYANKTEEEMETIGKKISEKLKGKMVGEKNPMFGKNPFANKTDEEMETICKKKSEAMKGKNAGKNPYANKTDEEMETIANKKSNSLKGKNAGKNPYANKTDEEIETICKKKSEAMKGKMAGEKHPKAKKVICITTGKTFDCIKDAEKYYSCSGISACCRGIRKHTGELDGTPLQWKYA